jgi:hypothetical protein
VCAILPFVTHMVSALLINGVQQGQSDHLVGAIHKALPASSAGRFPCPDKANQRGMIKSCVDELSPISLLRNECLIVRIISVVRDVIFRVPFRFVIRNECRHLFINLDFIVVTWIDRRDSTRLLVRAFSSSFEL